MEQSIKGIAKLIPCLRRHAFMLTGSRELADEHVRVCLQSLAADADGMNKFSRVTLFQRFYRTNPTINRLDDFWPDFADSYRERVWTTLQLLTTEECSALLLCSVEAFSLQETASILDLEIERLREVVRRARLRLAALTAKFVLIVEDDPLTGLMLNSLMAKMGFTTARLVRRMGDAVAAAEEGSPGLVLADVELDGEGDGISAARTILQNARVPIVFITSYPEKLLTRQGCGPAYVVPKPFTQERLTTVVDRALAAYASPADASSHRRRLLAHFEHLAAA